MKILGLLTKFVSKTRNEMKGQRGEFLSMLLGTLAGFIQAITDLRLPEVKSQS